VREDMSTPNTNNKNSQEKTQEKTSERVTINKAVEELQELKDFLMKNINTESYIDGNQGVTWIRAIERALSYINWARGVLKSRARQSNNYSYSKSYKKPYRKYYGGSRRWRRRY